ncbi:MAG: hypothetical protein QOJ59_2795 [Thermomicrobiales bacterium]|nr:hypothetical protein [Thermomicrobiales bacterium]
MIRGVHRARLSVEAGNGPSAQLRLRRTGDKVRH